MQLCPARPVLRLAAAYPDEPSVYPAGAVMKVVHIVVGVLCIALVGGAGLWGAFCWHRGSDSPWFWRALRAGQAAVVVEAALGGILLLLGRKESSLHLLYGLLPLAVAFVAEQLRIASAQMVLDSRGLASAAAVGELPEAEQRGIVLSILQRELGVMVIAALVMLVLLIRAAGTGG
jgi:hypothetical protein